MDDVASALRVAGVPVRLGILRVLAEHGPLSPSDLAQRDDTDATLREAAYHVRAMRTGGLITLHDVLMDGGTARHLYVASPLGRAIVDALPALERASSAR